MIRDRARLARLLKEAGSAYDADGVAALIAGVLAAPDEIGTGWHVLVADPMPGAACRRARRRSPAACGLVQRRHLQRRFRAIAAPGAAQGLAARNWRARGLDGFIVPRADEHQGEYVPQRGQRLAWLTGFTGSAGAGDGAGGPRRGVRRRPLHAAGGGAGRRRSCSRSAT